MSELTLDLADHQLRRLRRAAARLHMPAETLAAQAVRAALTNRYTLPVGAGTVVPLQSLKSAKGRRP